MIIKCPNEVPKKKTKWYIFLAGPIQGAPEWQFTLPTTNKNIIWLSPRRETYSNYDYYEQVTWETNLLRISDIILFYIPEKIREIKGRDYAQTTRTEFGEYIARGKKIIIGINKNFSGRTYIETKCNQYGIKNIHKNLEDCIKEIEEYIKKCENINQIFYTSDTHFSSERALNLSKRPFNNIQEMDWKLIENWNKIIHINDTVYHLGDFGSLWPLQYLNGKIILILGNYEKKIIKENPNIYNELKNNFYKIYEEPIIINNKYILCHEPLDGLYLYNKEKINNKNIFVLFGHIHGRQKIKKFGIDVGIDANNYFPISENDINFYKKAIDEKLYDEQVFCNENECININNKIKKVFIKNKNNELIKLLKIEYTDKEKEKDECDLFMYFINYEGVGDFYFFVELTEMIINKKNRCVICTLEENKFNENNKNEESLNNMIKLIEKYGSKYFNNLLDSANYLNNYK